ncbi:MAG TPA: hypothetical protein VE422_10215 [Terriglobia bacterium]|nr:hypothetical protein [Terriglobia bacterium]
MKKLITIFAAFMITATSSINVGKADDDEDKHQSLRGRIVALGIPGASTISAVGTFLPGGPIHDKPELAAFTIPGRVLDPVRILVGSTSNFGAPVANSGQRPGSFLSLDPRFPATLVIPPDFAAAGNQASALVGRVQMYSAQSPAFRNGVNNPSAVTAGFTAVSNPLGLSINNAFGRLWPANAPTGLEGIGTSTIVDPSGIPLAGAPSALAGGVFAGNLTPRQPLQLIPGALNRGAVGTAFLGRSPDGSNRAVFSVVLADGSLVQEHTAQNVDGLAPAGTVRPLLERNWNDDDDEGGSATPRLGVVLNYSPTRILYVSEPFNNTIAVLDLADNGLVFYVAAMHRIRSEALRQPIDLAPAMIETTNPNWASNTTLEVGADFYVANRGNNTVVRMRQDGAVVAVREVRLADGRSLGNGRLNGIAGSPDGSKIWVTVVGHLAGHGNVSGAVLELPAF